MSESFLFISDSRAWSKSVLLMFIYDIWTFLTKWILKTLICSRKQLTLWKTLNSQNFWQKQKSKRRKIESVEGWKLKTRQNVGSRWRTEENSRSRLWDGFRHNWTLHIMCSIIALHFTKKNQFQAEHCMVCIWLASMHAGCVKSALNVRVVRKISLHGPIHEKKFTFHGWTPSRATISLSQRSDSDRFMIKCCSRASRVWNDRLCTLLPKTDLVCIVFMKDI